MAKKPAKKSSAGEANARSREIQRLKRALKENPSDEGTFVKLWDLFVQAEAWEAMAGILRERIPALTDERERVRALLRLGGLCDEKLGDTRQAAQAYREVLAIEPANQRALWALGVIYHDLEDWEKVIEIYLMRIAAAQSPEEKLALRTQLAQIYEERLKAEDRALTEYIRAVRLAPQNVRILLHMEKLAGRTRSFQELLAVYQDVVERVERVELRVALYLKLARLHEQQKNDEAARAYGQKALELAGDDPQRLFAISSIYGEEEEWNELIAIYTRLIALAQTNEQKSRLRREIARLYRDGLHDPASAFFELVRLARYQPDQPGLVEELCSLGVECDKHVELAAVLQDLADRLPEGAARVALWVRLARLQLDDLHNADLARQAVERALQADARNLEAQLLRFDLLQTAREWERLAQALEAFLGRADLPADMAREQRKRLARLYEEKLDRRERAVELYRENLREPGDASAPEPGPREEILEQLYRRQGTWEELITLLGRRMQESADPETQVNLALEIAQIRERQLHQPDRAFFEIVRAAKQAPGDERLLDELFRLARAGGFTSEVLAVAEDLLATMPDAAAARVHASIGLLLEDEGRRQEALERFERALALDPLESRAYRGLRADLLSRNAWERLVELDLARASRPVDADEKIELLLSVAEVLEDRLRDDSRAADVYDRVLALDPTSIPARKGLSRLRGEAGQPAPLSETPAPAPPAGEPFADSTGAVPRPEDLDVTEPQGRPPVGTASATIQDLEEFDEPEPITEVTEPSPRPAAARRPEVAPPPPLPVPAPADEQDEANDFLDREPTLVERAPTPTPAPKEPPAQTPPPAPAPTAEPPQAQPEPPRPAAAPATETKDVPVADQDPDTSPMEEEPTRPGVTLSPEEAARHILAADRQDVGAWERLSQLAGEARGPAAAFDILAEGLAALEKADAQAVLLRRLGLLAQDTPLRLRLAELLRQRGRFEDAESTYRAILRAEPVHPQALDGLASLYRERKTLDRFDAFLSRALHQVTDAGQRRELLSRRARLRALELERFQEALEDLDLLAAISPQDLDLLTLQESLLERLNRFPDLVKAYERHLKLAPTPAARAELLMAIALLQENRLGNPEQAATYYRAVLEEDPGNARALEALIALLEKRHDWLGALEMLDRAASRVGDAEAAALIHYRRGKILEEQLLRPEEAEEAYRKGAAGQSPSRDALMALRGMARRRGDWVEVIRLDNLLLSGAQSRERAALLVEMAKIWRERLENQDKSLECFEEACRLDPDNLEAVRVVADLRLQTRRMEEAHEMYSRLASRGPDTGLEEQELQAVYLKMAQSAEALGRRDDAANAFQQALELAPSDRAVRMSFGHFLARGGEWGRAVELYRSVLEEQLASLAPAEAADLHCQVAQGLLQLGQREEAAAHYRQALRAFPRHLPAIRAAVEMAQQLGRHAEMVELLGKLRELSTSPQARFKLSVQMGDVLADAMAEPAQAAQAYRQALAEDPGSLEVLEKLRKALVRTEEFAEAVQVLERLAHLAPDEAARARYCRIAADVAAERLDDETRALGLYLRALQLAPLDARSQSAAVKILSRQRDWGRLAALWEELLRRLPPPIPGQPDRRIEILTELVELYRYRLNDPRKAIAACEQLMLLEPGNLKVREDLARLLEADGQRDRAADLHRQLIADSPFSVDSYHALRRICEARGDRDRTLCLCATLNFLDEANEDEQRLFREFRHALPIPPGRRMDEAQYRRLVTHPASRGLLGELFDFAADFARPLFAVDGKEYKLKPREALNLADRSQKMCEVIRDALTLLGLPEPEFYPRGMFVKGIMAVNTSPVAVLYAEESMRKATLPELRFMVARAVAFTRPENLLAASLTARQLRNLLEAMAELVLPGGPVHPVAEEVGTLARRMQRLVPPESQERLLQLARQYRAQSEELSIRDWLEGVEHTCNRVGLLASGDLDAAVQVLKSARVVSPSGSSRSLIRELIFYSISEEYFDLRRALQAAIQ
ncbi:MAG: tetratricopeptide repeat protein [Myxococcales bacterium]|nr:tetratricopeptide repeat protein [Myxococcales bacterium]